MQKISDDWKAEFPVFSKIPELVYLDSAATTLVPACVVSRISDYLSFEHANSHRGLYKLSADATALVDEARLSLAQFIGAESVNTIAFCSCATEALNILAQSFTDTVIRKGDNLIVSIAEHHANILPWQALCERVGAELRFVGLNEWGQLDVAALESLVDEHTRLMALTQVSNVLGVLDEVAPWAALAKANGVKLLVDGCQAVAHGPVDVRAMGCDFYVFSGHKMYAGSGVGVLYIRESHVDSIQPSKLGGGIVKTVGRQVSSLIDGIEKFEAGSRNTAAIVGLKAAVNFINTIGWARIKAQQKTVMSCLIKSINERDYLSTFIPAQEESVLVSVFAEGVHSHDLSSYLDQQNIAVRAGHHCAEPLHAYFEKNSSTRISLALYNNTQDIQKLMCALDEAHELLAI